MTPIIQIFGFKNCINTNKVLRFFKERAINIQFIDLNEKGISKGELDNIIRKFPLEELLDKDGKQFKKRNFKFMTYDIETELLNDPLLFKTPITRFGPESAVGYAPVTWKKWADIIMPNC